MTIIVACCMSQWIVWLSIESASIAVTYVGSYVATSDRGERMSVKRQLFWRERFYSNGPTKNARTIELSHGNGNRQQVGSQLSFTQHVKNVFLMPWCYFRKIAWYSNRHRVDTWMLLWHNMILELQTESRSQMKMIVLRMMITIIQEIPEEL